MTDGDRGASAVEVVILVPLLVLLMLFVVLVGRIVQARNDVYGAAADAARAASIRQQAGSARADAASTAARVLRNRDVGCRRLAVDTRVVDLRPGGSVAVTVKCTVDLRDLTGLAVPGRRTIEGSATEIVDRFRGR